MDPQTLLLQQLLTQADRSAKRAANAAMLASVISAAGLSWMIYGAFGFEHPRAQSHNEVLRLEAQEKAVALEAARSRPVEYDVSINEIVLMGKDPHNKGNHLYQVSASCNLVNRSSYTIHPVSEHVTFSVAVDLEDKRPGLFDHLLGWEDVLTGFAYNHDYLSYVDIPVDIDVEDHTGLRTTLGPNDTHAWTQTWIVSGPKNGWLKFAVNWDIDLYPSGPEAPEAHGWVTYKPLPTKR